MFVVVYFFFLTINPALCVNPESDPESESCRAEEAQQQRLQADISVWGRLVHPHNQTHISSTADTQAEADRSFLLLSRWTVANVCFQMNTVSIFIVTENRLPAVSPFSHWLTGPVTSLEAARPLIKLKYPEILINIANIRWAFCCLWFGEHLELTFKIIIAFNGTENLFHPQHFIFNILQHFSKTSTSHGLELNPVSRFSHFQNH